jgi:hypothetical protein
MTTTALPTSNLWSTVFLSGKMADFRGMGRMQPLRPKEETVSRVRK